MSFFIHWRNALKKIVDREMGSGNFVSKYNTNVSFLIKILWDEGK